MKDDNCIFCKLANGDIPTNTIYEDADFRVILDASPATKGHALILPKQHYANMFEIDDEVLAKAAKLAKKVITHEKEVLGCDGYNVLQNNGEAAGQTVFHFHMHLIPLSAAASRGDQILNAKSFAKQGFSYVIEEEKLTDQTLLDAVREVYADREKYIHTMSESGQMDSIGTILKLIESVSK